MITDKTYNYDKIKQLKDWNEIYNYINEME